MTKPFANMPAAHQMFNSEPSNSYQEHMAWRHNRDFSWAPDLSTACVARPNSNDLRSAMLPFTTDHLHVGSSPAPPLTVKLSSLQYNEKWYNERRRDMLVLVMRFLYDNGYSSAYQSLCSETRFSLSQVDAADNMDLLTIMHEYINYFRTKYGRTPILTRQTPQFEAMVNSLADQACKRQALAQLRTSGSQQPNYHSQSSPQSNQTHHSYQLEKQNTTSSDLLYSFSSGQPSRSPQVVAPSLAPTLAPARTASVVKVPEDLMQQPVKQAYSTTLSNLNAPVTQEDFIQALSTTSTPSAVFSFHRPRSAAVPSKRSSSLSLSNLQEDVLYALVGCIGVGWSLKNITEPTRSFLCNRFGISKELLQLFFKNRAQKRQRREEAGQSPSP